MKRQVAPRATARLVTSPRLQNRRAGSTGPGAAPPSAILDADVPFPLNHRVRHEDWGEGEVVRVEPDRVTMLFDEQGYRTLSLDAVQRSQVLRVVGEQ